MTEERWTADDAQCEVIKDNVNKAEERKMNSDMLKTDLKVCWDLGQKAALARHQHDESRAKGHSDYMRRFVAARPEEYRAQLRAQFDQAYRAESEIHMNAAHRKAYLDGKL